MNGPGTGTEEDRIERLTAAAESGDAESQFQLGLAYYHGDGLEPDLAAAALWFKRAARQEHPEGLYQFGVCLYNGEGIAEDKVRAFEAHLRGANLGNLKCANSVGYCYSSGEGVEQDDQLAVYWYRRAADAGHDAAQFNLGLIYDFGQNGIEENDDVAISWYMKSAAQRHSGAMGSLGVLYLQDGPNCDPLEGYDWLKKGAEAGDTYSMNRLGNLLRHGEQIAQNFPVAVNWLRKSAVLGGECYYDLTWALYSSIGDAAEIMYWAPRALAQPDTDVSAPLAQSYEDYDNLAMASFWWQIAKEQESALAIERLEFLAGRGITPESGKEEIARHGISEADVLNGTYLMAPILGDPPILRENLPVPLVVQQEMALNQLLDEGNPGPTDSLPEMNAPDAQSWPEPTQAARDSDDSTTRASQVPPPMQIHLPPISLSQLPLGSTLSEKYLIESVIGKGGMAIVFKARHLLMERSVAIKIMRPEVAKDQVAVARFQREAKNASLLRHPNVITIHDYGMSPDGQPYMVMDYLEGHSLEDLLERDRVLSIERAMLILTQVCDALGAAHDGGVVHRDVKPSNIMLENRKGNQDFVRLVDFGIAKSMDDQDKEKQKLTKTGEVFGSLVYMSPEQCMGKPLDLRSDVYSLGCVLYEILTGDTPFLGETVFETMSKHIYESPPPLAQLLPNAPQASMLEQIFFKAVAKLPEHRYQAMHEFKDDLLAIR